MCRKIRTLQDSVKQVLLRRKAEQLAAGNQRMSDRHKKCNCTAKRTSTRAQRSTAGATKCKAAQIHQNTDCMGARATQRMQAQGQIDQGAHMRLTDCTKSTKLQRTRARSHNHKQDQHKVSSRVACGYSQQVAGQGSRQTRFRREEVVT